MVNQPVSIIEALDKEIREMDAKFDALKHKAGRMTRKTSVRLHRFVHDHLPHHHEHNVEHVSHHYWDLLKSRGVHN